MGFHAIAINDQWRIRFRFEGETWSTLKSAIITDERKITHSAQAHPSRRDAAREIPFRLRAFDRMRH